MIVRVTVSLDVDVDNWKLSRFRNENPSPAEVRADVREWAEERLTSSMMAGQECAVIVRATP